MSPELQSPDVGGGLNAQAAEALGATFLETAKALAKLTEIFTRLSGLMMLLAELGEKH